MRTIITAAALAATSATGAWAQTAAGSHNPALKNPAPHRTSVAAKGRNSFTQAQARARIAKAGYTGVSGLVKDANGVWQGTATKGGAKANVSLDYKGDVTAH